MEVAGPFPGGHYFGVVPPDTTVSASGDEVVLLQHPHGRELKEFKASGKDKYVFFKAKDVLVSLQEAWEQLNCGAGEEQEGLPLKGSETAGKSPASVVANMISEVEDQVYTTARDRLERLSDVAEFCAMEIREVKASNKSNAGLMRRYKREHKEGQQAQLQDQCKSMKESLKGEQQTNPNIKDCIISLQNSLEETQDLLEDGEALARMSKIEGLPWETLFGLVGIPVSHAVQNYTDPMNIGINEGLREVVPSAEFALNQKSLWSLSGSGNTVVNLDNLATKWGFKDKVTAVVPIKSWNHPTVWKAYHNGPLSKMVMSAQLRGAHTPMQQDEQAFTAAALLRTVEDWPNPNEGQALLMADLLDTIQFTDPRSQGVPASLKEFMDQTEKYIVNNMPSALAPMAKMLESKHVLSFAGSEESGPFWRAIVSNSIYWKVRRAVQGKDRDTILRTLANFENQCINLDVLSSYEVDLIIYSRMLSVAQKFNKSEKIDKSLFEKNPGSVEDFKKFITNTNSSYNVFLLTEVVRAIISCGKVTKKLKHLNLGSDRENWQWMKAENDRREKLSSDEIDNKEIWEDFLSQAPDQSLAKFAESLNEAIPNEFEKFRILEGKRKHKFKVEELFERLKTAKATETEEKLKLLLFGRAGEETKWGNGKGLKNGQIAKQILDFLAPLLEKRPDSSLNIEKYERMIEKTNRYTKHWYRKKGSRRGYTNERPSFWAITGHTTPWSFLKKDKAGYEEFKASLKELDKENDPARKTFFQDWKHLLENEPTKTLPLATKKSPIFTNPTPNMEASAFTWQPSVSEAKSIENGLQLLSIFPHPKNTTFGLEGLMKTSGITAKDLDMDQDELPKAALTIASNWEMVLRRMLPQEQAPDKVHSLKEVFGIDENSFKAFNTCQLVKKMPDLAQRKAELIDVLKEAAKSPNENCLVDTENQDRSSDIYLDDEQIKLLGKNCTRILHRLLPLRAVELTKAIEILFKGDQKRMMSATYHVLQRYMDYGLTSMYSLQKLLMNEELIYSNKKILEGNESFFLAHPAVSFEVKHEVEGKQTEEHIKRSLQKILDDFMADENALLWMNQEYERSRKENNWEPLEITKEDLKTVSISVDEAWYGGDTHEMVTIKFDYQNWSSNADIKKEQKARMKELTDFFHLVLENVYQLSPITYEFEKNGETWQSNRKPGENDKDYETWEYKRVQNVFKTLKTCPDAREETASILKSLGSKGVQYNEAKKIKELLQSNSDVDNLTIRVQTTKQRGHVSRITCSPLLIETQRKTRFKELPAVILDDINDLMQNELLAEELQDNYEKIFDTFVNRTSIFKLEEKVKLAPLIAQFKSTPAGMVSTVVSRLKEGDRTLGDLIDAFEAITVKLDRNKALTKEISAAISALTAGLEKIMKDATKLSEKQAQQHFAKDRTLDTFLRFLKDHAPDGMRKYAKEKGFRKDKFMGLAEDQMIVPGDMIGFYRKGWGIEYAHAGIYAPTQDKKHVVHVQPKGGFQVRLRKTAEVKDQNLEEIIKDDDLVFFIRNCANNKEQAEVLSKVMACLYARPIEYTYNGYWGSCQTFCSKVLGSVLFEELNPEAFLTSPPVWKSVVGRALSSEYDCKELINKMAERFQPSILEQYQSTIRMPEQDESLMKTCPDSVFAFSVIYPLNTVHSWSQNV